MLADRAASSASPWPGYRLEDTPSYSSRTTRTNYHKLMASAEGNMMKPLASCGALRTLPLLFNRRETTASKPPVPSEHPREHFSTDTRVEGWNFTFKASPAGAIPVKVFQTEQTVQLNGATIVLKHYAPAHTDSDISVHFTNADILHVADTFWNGYYPFIDYSTGGSIDGTIRATEANLAKVTDKMIVIPGHGPVGDKSQLTFYRDLLVSVRDKVATLKKQGRSLDEIVAAKPTATTDAKWGGGFMGPKQFIGLVFEGV